MLLTSSSTLDSALGQCVVPELNSECLCLYLTRLSMHNIIFVMTNVYEPNKIHCYDPKNPLFYSTDSFPEKGFEQMAKLL